MNSHAVQKLLPAYLAGQLTPTEKETVAAHLAHCAVCREHMDSLADAETRIRLALQRQILHLPLPDGAWARLQAGLPTTGRAVRQPAATRRPALAFLAVAAVLAAAGLIFSPASAQLGDWVSRWLHIGVPNTGTQVDVSSFTAFTPLVPGYLPAGFDLTTTGIHQAPDEAVFALIFARRAERIVLVQRIMPRGAVALTGTPIALEHADGLLITDLSQMNQEYTAEFKASAPVLLVWDQQGIHVELYASLDAAGLTRIANSMAPAQR